MADKLKTELQDSIGNVFHIQTTSDIVFFEDGKSVQDKIGSVKNIIKTKEELALVTEPDFLPDAKAVADSIAELNGNKFQMKQAFSKSGIPKELLAGTSSSNVFSFTVTEAGYAYVDLHTSFPNGENRKMMILYKNGTEMKRFDDTTGTNGISSKISVSALFLVNAGDVITAKIFCATAGSATCNVSIHQFY